MNETNISKDGSPELTYETLSTACDGDLRVMQEILLNDDFGKRMPYKKRMPLLLQVMEERHALGEVTDEQMSGIRAGIQNILDTL